jgi:hypothetical protein
VLVDLIPVDYIEKGLNIFRPPVRVICGSMDSFYRVVPIFGFVKRPGFD